MLSFLEHNSMCFLFLLALDVLREFVQGPDMENQNVLINNYFVKTAKCILDIFYEDESQKSHFKNISIC